MLSYALELYLNNPNNHLVNFSLILQTPGGSNWFPVGPAGGNETLDQVRNTLPALFLFLFFFSSSGSSGF
jgi:hypothetical protein